MSKIGLKCSSRGAAAAKVRLTPQRTLDTSSSWITNCMFSAILFKPRPLKIPSNLSESFKIP